MLFESQLDRFTLVCSSTSQDVLAKGVDLIPMHVNQEHAAGDTLAEGKNESQEYPAARTPAARAPRHRRGGGGLRRPRAHPTLRGFLEAMETEMSEIMVRSEFGVRFLGFVFDSGRHAGLRSS